MWSNKGFENNGSNFNLHDYPPSPFGGHPGQQYFPQIPFQPNTMQLEGGNGEAFINGEFQPDMGLYNEGAFAQNHLANSANAHVRPSYSSCLLSPASLCDVQTLYVNLVNIAKRFIYLVLSPTPQQSVYCQYSDTFAAHNKYQQ
jgi:hypothetical protein